MSAALLLLAQPQLCGRAVAVLLRRVEQLLLGRLLLPQALHLLLVVGRQLRLPVCKRCRLPSSRALLLLLLLQLLLQQLLLLRWRREPQAIGERVVVAAQHRTVSGQRLLQLPVLPLVLLPLLPLLPPPLLLLLLPPLLLPVLLHPPWSMRAPRAAAPGTLTLHAQGTRQDHQLQKLLHLSDREICGPLDFAFGHPALCGLLPRCFVNRCDCTCAQPPAHSQRHSSPRLEFGRKRRQTDLVQEGPAGSGRTRGRLSNSCLTAVFLGGVMQPREADQRQRQRRRSSRAVVFVLTHPQSASQEGPAMEQRATKV